MLEENKAARPGLMAAVLAVSMALLLILLRPGEVPTLTPTRQLHIAFMSDRDGNYEIYLMARDGSGLTNLTHNEAQDGIQSWSPRANAFVFVTTRGTDNLALYRMDADGGHPVALSVELPPDVGSPIWSPTGEWVAFGSGGDLNPDVYLVDAAGANVRDLTEDTALDRFGDWSPDGQRLLFVSDRGGGHLVIYAIGLQGGEPAPLTDIASDSARPVWSPDGGSIAFMSNRDGDVEVYVMGADGHDITRLTNAQGFDGYPAWSPDGAKIAFITARDGNPEIYSMNPDGSQQTNLTNNPAQESLQGDFAWSPDGRQILFHSDRDGNVEVYVMNPDGSQQSNLTNNPATDFGSIWVP